MWSSNLAKNGFGSDIFANRIWKSGHHLGSADAYLELECIWFKLKQYILLWLGAAYITGLEKTAPLSITPSHFFSWTALNISFHMCDIFDTFMQVGYRLLFNFSRAPNMSFFQACTQLLF